MIVVVSGEVLPDLIAPPPDELSTVDDTAIRVHTDAEV